MPLAQNMKLHGHKTIPMHLAYLHLLPRDQQDAITRVFAEKFLQDIRAASSYSPGQMIVEGIAETPSYEQLLELTLCHGLTRGTDGLWGGFWTGALAEEGVVSPIRRKAQITLTEETFHHAVAQYRFEALGLAVSEVALERGTTRRFRATVASFLERQEIERVVSTYLENIQQGYLNTVRGVRLLEADFQAKRRFLEELAEMLHPWVQRYGLERIDQLVMELDPGTDVFQKQRGGTDAFDQEFPTAELENPEGLIRYSKELAQRNKVAVQAAVQAMQRRRMASHEITIHAVARESGVSRATIYRCDKLYAIVQKANPKLRRREAEQKIREDHARSQAEVAAAVEEKEQYKKEASLAQLGSQGLQQQIMQMKKKILVLQHEISRLTEILALCTCESKSLRVPHLTE